MDSKIMAKVQAVGPETPPWMRQGEVRRRIRQFGGGLQDFALNSAQKKAERDEREKEKEKEEKLEKARAAAWAWYQHGKGGKESVSSSSSSGGGAASMLTVRSPGEDRHKSSRFKAEALKTSNDYDQSISPTVESGRDRRADSSHLRTSAGWSWDFTDESQIVVSPVSRTSSLFDSYELASVSKRIDAAHFEPTLPTRPTRPSETRPVYVPHGEGPSEIRPAAFGLPAPMRPPGASAPYVPGLTIPESVALQQGGTIQHGFTTQQGFDIPEGITVPRSPQVTRRSSHRRHFLPCGCGSISDSFSREEITRALGIDIRKCDCEMTSADYESEGMSDCLHLRRITSALQELMHLPEYEYHPQRNHHERRQHHHLHLSHLRSYRSHDHKEYHHHLHYQIKLRDGMHQVRKAFGRSLGRTVAYWCFT